MVDGLREKLVEGLGELQPEAVDQVAECRLDRLGQHLLGLNAECADVAVGLEEVQKLGAVGHPKGQDPRVGVLLLDDAVYQVRDVVQEDGQLVGALRGLQLRAVVCGGSISG